MSARLFAISHRIALATLLLALSGASGAQEKAGARAPAKGAKAAVLTPAQLRDCMAQKERLTRQTDAALAVKAQIDSERAEIEQLNAALAGEKPVLDLTSAEAVGAFNAKVERRDKLLDAYQASVGTFNAQAGEVKTTKAAYENACENRRYDDRDLDDLKRRK